MSRSTKQVLTILAFFACLWGLHEISERDRTDPIKPPAPVVDELAPINWTAGDGAKHYGGGV